jgi:hypothetical protein
MHRPKSKIKIQPATKDSENHRIVSISLNLKFSFGGSTLKCFTLGHQVPAHLKVVCEKESKTFCQVIAQSAHLPQIRERFHLFRKSLLILS